LNFNLNNTSFFANELDQQPQSVVQKEKVRDDAGKGDEIRKHKKVSNIGNQYESGPNDVNLEDLMKVSMASDF